MTIQIGKKAPDFSLPAASGENVSLSGFRGKNVLLYFYPKDMTTACTAQACDLRDRSMDFAGADTVIIGISTDPVRRHAKFAEKYGLPFLLLADEEHTVAEKYGVWQEKSMYGRTYMGIVRSTFFIDSKGILLKEWRKVKVAGHVEEALRFAESLTVSRK